MNFNFEYYLEFFLFIFFGQIPHTIFFVYKLSKRHSQISTNCFGFISSAHPSIECLFVRSFIFSFQNRMCIKGRTRRWSSNRMSSSLYLLPIHCRRSHARRKKHSNSNKAGWRRVTSLCFTHCAAEFKFECRSEWIGYSDLCKTLLWHGTPAILCESMIFELNRIFEIDFHLSKFH